MARLAPVRNCWALPQCRGGIRARFARLYEILRSGRFVLVAAAHTEGDAVARPGIDHVAHTDSTLPAAILVRPDGYTACAARRAQLSAALTLADAVDEPRSRALSGDDACSISSPTTAHYMFSFPAVGETRA